MQFREFLFGYTGNCLVYFHVDTGGNRYIIKCGNLTKVPCHDEFLDDMRRQPQVRDVWTA